MKLFRTSDISVVTDCQVMFQFELPRIILKKRLKKIILHRIISAKF